jgi:hypothetical protein
MEWLSSLGGILKFIAGPWLEERRVTRREHLVQIKSKVLEPVCAELEEFYIPLLKGDLPPVRLASTTTRVDAKITEARRSIVWTLTPSHTRQTSLQHLLSPGEHHPPLSLELYEDAKHNHFSQLLSRFEILKAKADGYRDNAVIQAEELASTIARRTEIPVCHEGSSIPTKPWMNARGLAVFVLNCQLDAMLSQPFRGSDGRSIELDGMLLGEADDPQTIQRIIDVLDELARDKNKGSSPCRVGKRDTKSGSDGGVGQGFGHVRGWRNLA